MPAPSGTTPLLKLPYPIPDDDVNVPRDIEALAEALEARGAFIVGEVRFLALVATPTGWLAADGTARSRTTYAKLFAAIGTVWGTGDGSATFNLPDLRGRVVVGAGAGSGLTARNIATKWGVEAVVLSTAQMPSHAHSIYDPGHYHMTQGHRQVGNGYGVTNLADDNVPNTATIAAATGIGIYAAGGDQSHDNTQPSVALPAFIYAGV